MMLATTIQREHLAHTSCGVAILDLVLPAHESLRDLLGQDLDGGVVDPSVETAPSFPLVIGDGCNDVENILIAKPKLLEREVASLDHMRRRVDQTHSVSVI